jgi:hypothetical protein
MREIRVPTPSPAMVIALLALFVALGGGAYAALKLPKNSVGPAQLKKNSVTSTKVKDGALLAADFRAGQLPAGPKGADGAQGQPGAPGLRGPSDAWEFYEPSLSSHSGEGGVDALVISDDLPAGDYLVFANAMVTNNTPGTVTLHCYLTPQSPYGDSYTADISELVLAAGGKGNLVMSGPYAFPATPQGLSHLGIACNGASPTPVSGTVDYSDIDLDLLQVGTLH